MADVVLRLLGPLQVGGTDSSVTPPPGRVTTLLALLGMELGRVVSVDRLMDQLWGEAPPRSGPATLHVYVSRLRRLLVGTEAGIVTRAPGYVLDLPRHGVDAHLFTDQLAMAEQSAAAEDWPLTLQRTGRARELWRGPPFSGAFPCADLTVEADRLERLARRADELTVRALLELARPGEAYVLAEDLTRADRLNETFWRLRMHAAHQAGNAAAALADFEEFRSLLAEELGLDPSERLRQLQLEILRGDPRQDEHPLGAPTPPTRPAPDVAAAAVANGQAPRPARPTPNPTLPTPNPTLPTPNPTLPTSSPPLPTPSAARSAPIAVPTARYAERSDLLRCVTGSVSGSGRTVILEGEPGIGKSYLAAYAAATGRAEGARVLWARAIEGPGTPPLWMWEQILGLLSDDPERSTGADQLRAMMEADGSRDDGAEPGRARFRLSEAIVTRVLAVSAEQPLLLVFDDVQWADDGTLSTIRLLSQRVRDRSCSLVLTARTGAARSQLLDTTLASIAREESSSRHRVHPFSLDDVEQYLSERPAGLDSSDEAHRDATLLHQRSGGNPFFLGELLRDDVPGRRPPTTVAGLVSQRRSRLPDATRGVLDLAAVAGSSFDALVLARALDRPLIDVVSVMQPAVDDGFIVIDQESRSWRFVHDISREAILDLLSPLERARMHAQIADAVAEVHADDLDDHVDELADHRFRSVAGAPSAAAFAACTRAADRAAHRLAFDQAALHRSRALATMELGPVHRPERFEVLLRLTTERRLAGDVVGASASLRQAIELARLIGDRRLLTRAVTVLGGVTLWNWRQFEQVDSETVTLLEELLGPEGRPDPSAATGSAHAADPDALVQRVELLGTLAVELYYDDARPRGEELAVEAVALARRTGDPALLGRALNNFVITSWVPGRDRARKAALDEALALVGSGLPLATEVIARMHRSSLHLRAAEFAAFEEDLDRASWLAPRLGILEVEGQVTVQRAGWALLRQDWPLGRELIERAHHQLVRTSIWGAEWTRLVQLTTLSRVEGRLAELVDALVAKASEDAHRTLRWTAVLALAEVGETQQARSLQSRWGLRSLARRSHWGSTFEWAQAGETSLLLGTPAPNEVYAALATVEDALVVAGTGVAVWGPVADVQSRLAARLGDAAASRRHAQESAELSRRVRAAVSVGP